MIQEQLQKSTKFMAKVRQVFESIDEDGLGVVTINRLVEHMQKKEMQAFFSALELDTSDALSFFNLLDKGGSQYIDCEDFLMCCTRLKGSAKAIHMAQLSHENRKIRRQLQQLV